MCKALQLSIRRLMVLLQQSVGDSVDAVLMPRMVTFFGEIQGGSLKELARQCAAQHRGDPALEVSNLRLAVGE